MAELTCPGGRVAVVGIARGIPRDLGFDLPGARFRRHVLWRYSLTWTKEDAR